MATNKNLAEQLERILLNKARTKTGMVEAAKVAEQEIRNNFDKYQSQWRKLAKSTIAQRIALGYAPTPILIRSGDLLKHSVEKVEINDTKIVLSSNYKIARIQNYGTGKIPARPFYNFDDEAKTKIYQAFLKGYTK